MKINKITFTVMLFLTSSIAFSENNVLNTQTRNTLSQNSEITTTHLGTAKNWELSDKEWNRYLTLMQGPSGHYYERLSPPEVLGINSDIPEDIRHFAEVSAKQEHDKLERELKFNAAFHEAAARLYSAEPIIKPFDIGPFTPIPRIQS